MFEENDFSALENMAVYSPTRRCLRRIGSASWTAVWALGYCCCARDLRLPAGTVPRDSEHFRQGRFYCRETLGYNTGRQTELSSSNVSQGVLASRSCRTWTCNCVPAGLAWYVNTLKYPYYVIYTTQTRPSRCSMAVKIEARLEAAARWVL